MLNKNQVKFYIWSNSQHLSWNQKEEWMYLSDSPVNIYLQQIVYRGGR